MWRWWRDKDTQAQSQDSSLGVVDSVTPPTPDVGEDEYYAICADMDVLNDLLRSHFNAHRPIRVLHDGQEQAVNSRISACNHKESFLWVLAPQDKDAQQRALATGQMQMAFEHQGEQVLVSMELVGLETRESSAHYVLRWPSWALLTRFRRFPRFKLSHSSRQHPDVKRFFGVDASPFLVDVSEGGVGLKLLENEAAMLQQRTTFALSDLVRRLEGVDGASANLRIRHTRQEAGEERNYRIGAEFTNLSQQQLREWRRLLMLLQARSGLR